MPFVAVLWVTLGGFLAGAFEAVLIGRAARFLAALLGKSLGEPKDLVPKRRTWAIPLLVAHPASILLAGMLWLTYLVYVGRVAPVWRWFVGAFFVSILLMIGSTFFVISKAKRARSRAAGA